MAEPFGDSLPTTAVLIELTGVRENDIQLRFDNYTNAQLFDKLSTFDQVTLEITVLYGIKVGIISSLSQLTD